LLQQGGRFRHRGRDGAFCDKVESVCDKIETGRAFVLDLLSREGGQATLTQEDVVCRNIKTLHNFQPPATDDEIRASALQFVRKLSGFSRVSKVNAIAFDRAVDQVASAAHELLDSLVTEAPPRDRKTEAAKAKARAVRRFAASGTGNPS
jgi:hypothetical protein